MRPKGFTMNSLHRQKLTRIIPLRLAALALALTCFSGCKAPPPPVIRGAAPLLVRPRVQRTTIGRSFENRPIEKIVLGNGSDVILFMAAIHGDEPAGTPLGEMLADHLKQYPMLLDGKTVVIMPLTNPDGKARNTRGNAQGIDLNRNFSAPNREDSPATGMFALSEPESQLIWKMLVLYQPNRIISIHQPLNCIDYDGPAEELARHMAAKCDLPIRKLGTRPGSLGAYAGETLNIPVITLELKPNDQHLSPAQLWQQYGQSLLAAVTFPTPPQVQLGQ